VTPNLVDTFGKLDERSFRRRLYASVALAFFLLALLTRTAFFTKPANFIVSDALAYYVYLPMLIIDHTVDPKNQVEKYFPKLHWVIDVRKKTELGAVHNKYPIGFALTLAPAFLGAHVVSKALFSVSGSVTWFPNGYTGAYQIIGLLWIMSLGLCSMIWLDRMLVTHLQINGAAAGFSILAFWIGTHYAYYYFREPFMVHVVSTFWVCAVVCLAGVVLNQMERERLPAGKIWLLAFSAAMAILCRPTNVFVLPFFFHLGAKAVKTGLLPRLVKLAPLWLTAFLPWLCQMALWLKTTGHLLHYSYVDERFHWMRPALWQTLFSSRHGLFFWSPVLLLSVFGIAMSLRLLNRRSHSFLVCHTAAACLLWYLNSCWHQWWFGDAFGARAFLELSGFFVTGLALFGERACLWARKYQIVLVVAVTGCLVYNYMLMALYVFQRVSRSDYLFR